MGGTSFLAETATVDGRAAALAHSAAEASLFYAILLFGTLTLSSPHPPRAGCRRGTASRLRPRSWHGHRQCHLPAPT